MMRRTAVPAAAFGLCLAGFAGLIGSVAIEDVYAKVFGPPVLGFVDFATLVRRASPNDALACPPDVCLKARIDLVPPDYPVPAERLRAIVAEVVQGEPRTMSTWANSFPDEVAQDRYGVRSRIFRFPDTVNVEVVARGANRSTLALYSRSQIGTWDFGVNRARLERWLQRIGERVGDAREVSEG